MRIVFAGAGIFGVTGALELARRGHEVTVLDPGPVPHPLAESTDVSKVVRMDYGADEEYMAFGERALAGWRRWNAELAPLFRETGVTFLSRTEMVAGGFEHDSYAALQRRGHRPERLDAAAIAARFPAYRPGALVDGYWNPDGGWADASATVRAVAGAAHAAGVVLRGDVAAARLLERGGRVRGVITTAGEIVEADCVVVTAGSWSAQLVPALAGAFRAVGQPVFHLRPDDEAPYRAACFPVFGADIARTGFYGFPVNAGIVKIANHGVGIEMSRGAPREVTDAQEAALRAFLADTLPGLAAAPIVHRRLCVYCDTSDEHFWIAADPSDSGLVVAAGGSGHAFKFAPLLGEWISAAVLGSRSVSARFRWRVEVVPGGEEAARHR